MITQEIVDTSKMLQQMMHQYHPGGEYYMDSMYWTDGDYMITIAHSESTMTDTIRWEYSKKGTEDFVKFEKRHINEENHFPISGVVIEQATIKVVDLGPKKLVS